MTPGRVEPWLRRLFTLLGRDAWIAMATTYSLPEEQRIAYLTRRLQNTWLLHVWPVIDKYLRDSKTPDHQALYLALGFFQATTTWQWPATASWSTVLGQRPAHWLPRALFHLCWLLYEAKDEGHRKSLVRALLEGSSDAQRPGVAEKLMAVCPVESVLV